MIMNVVRVTYLVLVTIEQLFFVLAAILTPVYITPNNYWWSIFLILLLFSSAYSFTKRVNQWGILGEI